ncbi:aromatic aminobenezylarsenical efflux permease ArsG family transporter [uncultured Flavobacterium sp.]|uniref:aromatic aminobenezylarsenical efflux permease ArsG family transporter n=1 Tax=uncultured Flavobacterium sp. TaxID=165435 RepID=UPI0030C8A3CF
METVNQFFNDANMPIFGALLLGLMTAISPCPLATNITATAYISKTLSSKKKVLLSGFLYTLGLALTYTLIALIIIFGASKFQVAKFFQGNGEKFVGPVMVLIGLVMLNIIKLNFFGKSNFTEKLENKFKDKGLLGSFLLGSLFAMAFCPYSGAMYFGILIPMSIKSSIGFALPFFYAIGAGSLVLFFTFLIAFSMQKVGKYFKIITKIEKVMRLIAGILFVLTGFYYIFIYLKLI